MDTRETAYADGVQVQCGYRVSRSLYLPVYFLDFALFYALPLGLATVCYALIARVLFAGPLPPGDPGRSGSVHQGGPAGQGRLSSNGRRGAFHSRKQVGPSSPRSFRPCTEPAADWWMAPWALLESKM